MATVKTTKTFEVMSEWRVLYSVSVSVEDVVHSEMF